MRIGILTFHCAHNYGAVLQSYALQQYLLSLGYKVEIIDYRPEYLVEPYRVKLYWWRFFSKNPIECIKRFFSESFYYLPMRLIRYYAFDRFINKKLLLSHAIEGNLIPKDYDVYIVGSDQVWNPKITNGFDDVYFARFSFNKGNKKYLSYAASMGKITLSQDETMYLTDSLKCFDKISVREHTLVEMLQPITDNNIELVLDPTLLVNPDIWNTLAVNPLKNKKYVLVYAITMDDEIMKIARKLANCLNVEIVELTSGIVKNRGKFQTASPMQFLGAIKNADFVITTSFHATIFSILFKVPFYVIKLNSSENSRAASLLNMLGITDRTLLANEDVTPNNNIDWNIVDNKLQYYRELSRQFLDSSL